MVYMSDESLPQEEYQTARAAVERFARRFRPLDREYRLLACHAALPLVLTPELLNYLRTRFLHGQVPWVAEVDLLLSELCQRAGYEQYTMDPGVRAYLLREMRKDPGLGPARMEAVAHLLIHYVRYLSRSNRFVRQHELQAQQWAAMVYLDDHRDTAVREIAAALQNCVLPGAGPRVDQSQVNQAEMARLSSLVQDLAPGLEAYPELVEYAANVTRLLADETGTEARKLYQSGQLRGVTHVAGTDLPTLEALAPGITVQRDTEPMLIENPYVAGSPIHPELKSVFVGREDLFAAIQENLAFLHKPTLVLHGQRHMGMTSVLLHLPSRLSADCVPVFVNLQAPESLDGLNRFLYALARAAVRQADENRHIALPPVELEDFDKRGIHVFYEWLEQTRQRLGGRLLLFALDEFEMIERAIEQGRMDAAILDVLRLLIQQHSSWLVFLFASSRTLEEMGPNWHSLSMNVTSLHISYLDPAAARALILLLTRTYPIRYEEQAVEAILEATRAHPFLVQLVCFELIQYLNSQQRRAAGPSDQVILADAQEAIDWAMRSAYLYFENLWASFSVTEQLVLANLASGQGEWTRFGDLSRGLDLARSAIYEVLEQLERRDLIERRDGEYRFQVPMVRQWIRNGVSLDDVRIAAQTPPEAPRRREPAAIKGEPRTEDKGPLSKAPPRRGEEQRPALQPDDLLLGKKYRILELLGKGSLGDTYLAEDQSLRLKVAIKHLWPGRVPEQAEIERFAAGARTIARIRQENVIIIHAFGKEAENYYLVTEYADEGTVADLIQHNGRLPVLQALEFGGAVIKALEATHAEGLVHRDVKPRHILLVSSQGGVKAKLGGFDLVHPMAEEKLLEEKTTYSGTIAYSPPEQLLDEALDPRADLYALGATLYEMLTGQPPFPQSGSDDLEQTIRAILTESTVPPSELNPDVSPEIDALVLKALSKSPTDRYPDARAMGQALAQATEACKASQKSKQAPHARDTQDKVHRQPENPFFHRGAVRDPRYFFGRTTEIRRILALVRRGQSVSVVGPRRIGKTSLLFHLSNPETAAMHGLGENQVFVYVDCQVLSDLDRLQTYQWLWKETKKTLKIQDEMGGWDPGTSRPLSNFSDLRDAMEMVQNRGYKLAFLFDEFEALASSPNLGADFFNTLRALSMDESVVYVTTSRASLLELVYVDQSVLTSPFSNIFHLVRLGLMEPHEARDMVDGLAAMTGFKGFDEADHDFLHKVAGFHPFHLQVAAYYLFEEKMQGANPRSQIYRLVTSRFYEDMERYFHYTWERLSAEEWIALKQISEGREDEVSEENMKRLEQEGLVYQGAIFSQSFADFVRKQKSDRRTRSSVVR